MDKRRSHFSVFSRPENLPRWESGKRSAEAAAGRNHKSVYSHLAAEKQMRLKTSCTTFVGATSAPSRRVSGLHTTPAEVARARPKSHPSKENLFGTEKESFSGCREVIFAADKEVIVGAYKEVIVSGNAGHLARRAGLVASGLLETSGLH